MSLLTINIDGASRGNPGPAAYGLYIARDGQPPWEEGARLGHTTNNIAEYTALIRALERARALGGKQLLIRSDSELLVKQMNGEYRVKNDQILKLYEQAKRLCGGFERVSLQHVRREYNRDADRLCNEALDGLRDDQPSAMPPPVARTAPEQPAVVKVEPVAAQELDSVAIEAIRILDSVRAAWARQEPEALKPAQVWERLLALLKEHKRLRTPSARKPAGQARKRVKKEEQNEEEEGEE